jgi:diguanylate cyclase (GGDEF)-like protein
MRKAHRTRRADPSEQRLATDPGAPPADLAPVVECAVAVHVGERVANRRQEAADLREEVANRRQDTADVREGVADRRQDTADVREGVADRRQEAADLREEVADRRQEAADLREEIANRRQEAAELHQQIANLREEAARAKAVLDELASAQLREANEHLVVAAAQAQAMTETAEETAAHMTYMAEHDVLTGLPNRTLLTDRLDRSIALAQRHGKKVALMYVDLDRFKQVNDSLGHPVGDRLLQSVAKRLQACVRQCDTVSRQGGDEFLVLLTEIESAREAGLAAERLIEAMDAPHLIDGHRLEVTLSIGMGLYPDDGGDAVALVRNADLAMYRAKNSGRNHYRRYTPDMHA